MGNTAMRKSGQSLIVETGIFEWPWHTPFGLAIITGACGGGGGGGGALCIHGLNLYGAGGGGEAAEVRQLPCGSDKGHIERLAEMEVTEAMVAVGSTERPQKQKTELAATLAMAEAAAVERLLPPSPNRIVFKRW